MLRRGKGSEEGHVTGKQRWGANLPSPVPTQEEGLSVSLTPAGSSHATTAEPEQLVVAEGKAGNSLGSKTACSPADGTRPPSCRGCAALPALGSPGHGRPGLGSGAKEERSGPRPLHFIFCRAGATTCHCVTLGKSLSLSGSL